jgi:hypothetical protein
MRQEILINTITGWDEPPRARHQFAYAISKKMPVVFIAKNKTNWFRLRTFTPEENIVVVEPYFPVDYRIRYRLPIINDVYQIWLFKRLRKMYPGLFVVNFDFTAVRLHRYFRNNVYYCHDEYAGNSKYNIGFVNRYISSCERKVAQKASFCITTSKYLTDKISSIHKHTYEIPLGASISYDADASNDSIRANGKIILGYMGVINENHSSVHIVNEILKDDRFFLMIIGPVEKSFKRKLTHSENIEFTGTLRGEELASKLRKIDIGLALYNMERVNPGTTPNKLWQYLSLGKPVVVSDLPNLKTMRFPEKSVYVLQDEKLVVEILVKAYQENAIALKNIRIDFARQNTWDQRIEVFLEVFHNHF